MTDLLPIAYQLEFDEFSSIDVQLVMKRNCYDGINWAIMEALIKRASGSMNQHHRVVQAYTCGVAGGQVQKRR